MNFSVLSKAFVCLLVLSIVFAGCKKEDDSDDCTSRGTFTCKLDGQVFTATSFNNTLLKGVDNSLGGVSAKRLDIRGVASNGAQIILSISDFRDGAAGDGFRTGKYYVPYNQTDYGYCGNSNEGIYACVGGLVTYYPTSGYANSYMSLPSNDTYDGDSTHYVIITENNESARTISGRFKVAVESFSSGDEFLITEGEFTNVCYTILQ